MSNKKIVRVRDVMKNQVDVVDGKMTVMEALSKMRFVETKALIVEKRNECDEYGIVVLSDIAKQVLAKDRSPHRVNIYEIMTKPVVSVRADMDIRYCARLFEQLGLARVPVIEDERIIGMVSFTDMVLKGLVEFD